MAIARDEYPCVIRIMQRSDHSYSHTTSTYIVDGPKPLSPPRTRLRNETEINSLEGASRLGEILDIH